MADTLNNKADPKEVENALAMWHAFTRVIVRSATAAAAILLLMLIFLY